MLTVYVLCSIYETIEYEMEIIINENRWCVHTKRLYQLENVLILVELLEPSISCNMSTQERVLPPLHLLNKKNPSHELCSLIRFFVCDHEFIIDSMKKNTLRVGCCSFFSTHFSLFFLFCLFPSCLCAAEFFYFCSCCEPFFASQLFS